MEILLDTHAFIWFFSGNSKLSQTAKNMIEDINNLKLISLASVWEMAIKQSKGKLTLGLPLDKYINRKLNLDDFELLPIQLNHLKLITSLPFYHNDPFDRLLISQSTIENIPILSCDSAFNSYNINVIWN